MQNIGETPVAGTQWIRAEQIVLDNPYNGVPGISYIEKKMTVLSDGTTFNEPFFGGLSRKYVPGEDFDLISPVDGSVIPKAALASMASADVLQLLIYSDYVNQVKIRMATQANPTV